MDQECRYFVASVSSLDSGIPYSHNRWCQVSLELDALPENMEHTIPQPNDRIPSTTPLAEPPRDARDSGSARSHSMHLETSSSDRP